VVTAIVDIMVGRGVDLVPVLDMLGLQPYLLAPGHHQQEQEKPWKWRAQQQPIGPRLSFSFIPPYHYYNH